MSTETVQVTKCDQADCQEETEANISESTFGQVDITYQTVEDNSGMESHQFCGNHFPAIYDGLVALGLITPPTPPAEA